MAGGGAVSSGNGKAYPGKLTKRVLVTSIVAAMGGMIFGYDLGISGITYEEALSYIILYHIDKTTCIYDMSTLLIFSMLFVDVCNVYTFCACS